MRMIRLKDLLVEAAVMDVAEAERLAKSLAKELKAPHVHTQVSTLGGKHRPSVLVSLSLDPKDEWINNIFHNSRYSQFHISHDGVIEQFTYARDKINKKFRKTRFTDTSVVADKINKYLEQVK